MEKNFLDFNQTFDKIVCPEPLNEQKSLIFEQQDK